MTRRHTHPVPYYSGSGPYIRPCRWRIRKRRRRWRRCQRRCRRRLYWAGLGLPAASIRSRLSRFLAGVSPPNARLPTLKII